MYDYLAKVILLGPSGAGKSVVPPFVLPLEHTAQLHANRPLPSRSCVLHRFVKNECTVLCLSNSAPDQRALMYI